MFLFGEKIENSTFLPFLTPQKRNLVGPSETIWPLFRIWGSNWLEPQIRKSNVHCILVLSRQNLKSGIPDLRFLYNVQWKWNLKSGKVTIPPQKWPNLVAKKVKMRAPKKRLSPNPYGHGHFAKKRIQIGHFWPLRPHLQSTPPYIPHICHIVHMWDMWRKICHVEKFQISIHGKWGEIWKM